MVSVDECIYIFDKKCRKQTHTTEVPYVGPWEWSFYRIKKESYLHDRRSRRLVVIFHDDLAIEEMPL